MLVYSQGKMSSSLGKTWPGGGQEVQACPMEYLHLCRISGERRATGRKEKDGSEEKNQKCYCVGQDFLFNLDLINNEKNTYI